MILILSIHSILNVLIVKDDGIGQVGNEECDPNNHEGWAYIKVFLLNGKMSIAKCTPTGLCFIIFIPMKGEES
ncbi:hypothetical protein [Lysinibacillus sphaericus]|uniref:SalK-like protein n=1 Tax=Lysinibacillus sphaericus OT4b.31 TaxID=1285586 RepID=R7ZEU0_LYSSH|nr:hypothetical protein [Lysinibacillus sphaericus]EON72544.1 SalK-like protein [Lysinibacillus sphaericus OT4b.31]